MKHNFIENIDHFELKDGQTVVVVKRDWVTKSEVERFYISEVDVIKKVWKNNRQCTTANGHKLEQNKYFPSNYLYGFGQTDRTPDYIVITDMNKLGDLLAESEVVKAEVEAALIARVEQQAKEKADRKAKREQELKDEIATVWDTVDIYLFELVEIFNRPGFKLNFSATYYTLKASISCTTLLEETDYYGGPYYKFKVAGFYQVVHDDRPDYTVFSNFNYELNCGTNNPLKIPFPKETYLRDLVFYLTRYAS